MMCARVYRRSISPAVWNDDGSGGDVAVAKWKGEFREDGDWNRDISRYQVCKAV